MPHTYGTVQVKRIRGKLRLIGMGKTGRGQSYIKGNVTINAPSIDDPQFKRALAQAIVELFDESEAPG